MFAELKEKRRIKKLQEYEEAIPDTRDEFKNMVELLASRFNMKYAGIQFLDEEKENVKASYGWDIDQIDIHDSICYHTLQTGGPLIIPDLTDDSRTKNKPAVVNPPYFKSYLGVPLTAPDGCIVGTVCVMDQKIRQMDESHVHVISLLAEEIINKFELHRHKNQLESISEKRTTLLQEIHHRLKNNLALISGLVELENLRVEDDTFSQRLKNIQMRIKSVATMHERLYESKSLDTVDLESYLKELMKNHQSNFSSVNIDIDYNIEGETVLLSEEKSIYVGLLVNELLTNIFKHAFNGRSRGEISIQTECPEDQCKLTIKDDGVGLPADFNLEEGTTLGNRLLTSFTDQLNGTLDYNNDDGACFEIRFPH